MEPSDPTKPFSGLGLLAGYKPNALHGLLDPMPAMPPAPCQNAMAPTPPAMPPFDPFALPPLPAAAMRLHEPASFPSMGEIIADIVRAEEARAARILPDWRRRAAWINTFGSIDVERGLEARLMRIDRDAKKGSAYYWHADHTIPLERDGPDTPSNLRALNDFSNMSEGDRT
jgi:hypothetical protein